MQYKIDKILTSTTIIDTVQAYKLDINAEIVVFC